MSRNTEYLCHYLGPAIFIKTKSKKFIKNEEKIECCGNINCIKYGKKRKGFPNFCSECGYQIKYQSIQKDIELLPTNINEEIFDNFTLFYPNHYNGIEQYIKQKDISDDELVYVPFTEGEDFEFGIFSFEELTKNCMNSDCEMFEEGINCKYHYCIDCGKKLDVNFERDVHSIFKDKKTDSLLKKYANETNVDSISIIEDSSFDKALDDFKQTLICKETIQAIEKAYGKGSASVVLVNAKYHQNY